MKRIKKSGAFLVAMALILGLLAVPGRALAAGKPQLTKKSMTLYVGQSKKIPMKNIKGKKVFYRSNRTSVCTVSQKGKVKAKGEGRTTIEISVEKGKYRFWCTINVKPALVAKKTETVTIPGKRQAQLYIKTTKPGTPMTVTIRTESDDENQRLGVFDSVDTYGTDLNQSKKEVTINWTEQEWLAVDNYGEEPVDVIFEIRTKDGKKTIEEVKFTEANATNL